MGTNDFIKTTQSAAGEILINTAENAETNADIIFVIDATQSMAPVLNRVKELSLSLHDNLISGLKQYHKSINQLRVKVIAFRDYYCDGALSVEKSEFFYLPNERYELKKFVSGITAKGGGDDPESGLEALALAMRSDWVQEGNSKRHIIVLFTDAPAHPLEQQKDGIPENYPENMFKSYNELYEAWGTDNHKQSVMGEDLTRKSSNINSDYVMDKRARRLVLFAPNIEPWSQIKSDFEQVFATSIERDRGGRELNSDAIINLLAKSV